MTPDEKIDAMKQMLDHRRAKINESLSRGEDWRFLIKHKDGSSSYMVIRLNGCPEGELE